MLNDQQKERALNLFDDACDEPPHKVEAVLARAREAGEDPVVLEHAAKMLAHRKDADAVGFPDRFGPFVVRRPLGHGGVGEVFEAWDSDLGRPVAIKRIRGEHLERMTELFQHEVDAVARLNHPHIVTLYQRVQIDGEVFLVYEFMAGGDLRRLLRPGCRPSWQDAARLIASIADALDYAHTQGPKHVHRDVKPENILLDQAGNAKLTDFGIAATEEDLAVGEPAPSYTPSYRAPEQGRHKPSRTVGWWSDVYSLGLVLYELLAGKRPPSVQEREKMADADPGAWRFLDELDAPQGLRDICRRALRLRIEDRTNPETGFAGAGDMRDALLHAVTEAQQDAPERWNIPPDNPFFLDADHYLDRIKELFARGRPVALVGLPGVGKTQIAIHYAHTQREEHDFVFWVNAATRESLTSGFVTIGEVVQLPASETVKADRVIKAVKRWLGTSQSWLLVLDNADDLSVAHEFIPSCCRGRILLTTCDPAVRRLAEPLSIESMPEPIGAELLLRRAGIIRHGQILADAPSDVRESAMAVGRATGGLPLALDQAGAYIEETQLSVAEYLHLYRERGSLLRQQRDEVGAKEHASVAVTFSLAIGRIAQRNPLSAELLSVCAFLWPDLIFEDVLVACAAAFNEEFRLAIREPLARSDMIREASRFSLLRRVPESKAVAIHRLVQHVILDGAADRCERLGRVTRGLARVLHPADVTTDLSRCDRLFPHVCEITQHLANDRVVSEEVAILYAWMGRYLSERDLFEFSERALVRAKDTWSACGITSQESRAFYNSTLESLALLWAHAGRSREAERLLRAAVRSLRHELGEGHPEAVGLLGHLATVLIERGRRGRAATVLRVALKICAGEERLAEQIPLHYSLAHCYLSQKEFVKAEECARVVARGNRRLFGERHPQYAAGLELLAHVSAEREDYAAAESLLRKALTVFRDSVGETSSSYALCLMSLGSVMQNRGRYSAARRMFEEALPVMRRSLGPGHKAVAELERRVMRCGRMEPVGPLDSGSQPRRNDRCPCGSGKKYKHCCLHRRN